MLHGLRYISEYGIYVRGTGSPAYTIYFDTLDPKYDKDGLAEVPLIKRVTTRIVECESEADMRSKYNYIMKMYEKELEAGHLEIEVYKETKE